MQSMIQVWSIWWINWCSTIFTILRYL